MTDESFDDAFIAKVKAATDIAAVIGRGLKLVKKGREYAALCPFHSEKTPSFKVNPDKGFYHCFGCGAHGDAVDYLRQTQNMTFAEAIESLASEAGLVSDNPNGARRQQRASKPSTNDRRTEALAFWEASRLAVNTPGAEHLRCRGILRDPPDCIRYHEGKHCLVALVQAKDGTFSGIQRIYLATDSRGTWKTGRFSLGPVKGGAVRLTPAAESLQLCESVEDGLALLQMTGKATWAVAGAGFMASFEPPPEVRELVLAPDHDEAGLEAIERTHRANCASDTQYRLRRLLPPQGQDWCDVLEDHDERSAIEQEPEPLQSEPRSWVEDFCDGD